MKKKYIVLLAVIGLFVSWPTAVSALSVESDLIAREVTFQGDSGDTFHGSIVESKTAQPGRPGIVLVHGSGSGSSRTRLLPEATGFARQGMSVLIYDKRSKGYSGFQRSYSQLANDALGAVSALRTDPSVDPAKVGLWGISEGGWVVPLAATRSADVAFVVVVGANAMEPLRQQSWSDMSALRRHDVSGSLVDRAAPTMFRLLGDAGLFAQAHYDAAAVLEQLKQPLLGIWGSNDLSTPPSENPPLFAAALEKGGNSRYTFQFFNGADHAVHQTPDGGVTRLPLLAPGYADAVGSWVSTITSGRAVTDPHATSPTQTRPSVLVPPLSWWESTWIQAGFAIVFGVGFAGYALTALVRRIRRRTVRPVIMGGPARVLAGAGIITVPGFFLYLVFLLTDGAHDGAQGPVLAGRPLPWLILQALALTTVIALVMTVIAWRGTKKPLGKGEHVRLALLLTAGSLFVPWAFYWGLLLA